MYGKNARRMRVKDTYRDLYDILEAFISGRDEQFVGILVKGYHVTPQIPVHLHMVSDSKNFSDKCIGDAFSSLARGQMFSSFTVGTGTYASLPCCTLECSGVSKLVNKHLTYGHEISSDHYKQHYLVITNT